MIRGVEADRFAHLPEALARLPRMEERLPQPVVGVRIVRGDLEYILVLDDRLIPLLFLEVRVSPR